MPKLVLTMQLSLDGFVGGPKGEVDWAFADFDEEFQDWQVAKLWEASAHLMGSVTYYEMAAHWPSSTEPYAAPMNRIPKVLFSKSLKQAEWSDTQIVSGDLATEVARLKQGTGDDLLAHGGALFARSLIRTGLIDEYRLLVHPIVLGNGRPLFSELAAPMRFKLVETKTFKTGLLAHLLRPA